MFKRMLALPIMTPITGKHLRAAGEPKPPETLRVMRTTPFPRQFRTSMDPQILPRLLTTEGPARPCRSRADEEEFQLRDAEGHFLVAFSADGHGGVASYGDDTGGREWGRAFGAGGGEVAESSVSPTSQDPRDLTQRLTLEACQPLYSRPGRDSPPAQS